MITSSKQRITRLTDQGVWGNKVLHTFLEQNAAQVPDRVAFKDQFDRKKWTNESATQLSWRELANASENLAIQLQKAGVGQGDRVIVQLPNVVELAVIYFAFSKIGAVVSPVPIQYGQHELRKVQSVLESKYLICLAQFKDNSLVSLASDALSMVTVLCFGKDLIIDSQDHNEQCNYAPNDANRILTICWTSGTTGTPKGVPRSHNMWVATGRLCIQAADHTTEDVLLNPFPFVNMAALGGFMFPAAILGCSLVFHHPIDVPVFLQQMQDEKISYTLAPPALLNQLAKSEDLWNQYDFSALRSVGSGSAPLSPWMVDIFDNKYGKPIVNYYGSNEGVNFFSNKKSAPDPEARAAIFSLNQSNGLIKSKVINHETGELITEQGQKGELLISGASVFDGYLNTSNDQVFSEDGYFHTGDLVELSTDDGTSCRIVGRCKDIINRGGMKISPAEIDILLEAHPSLAEAAVCAYPDERLGEKICAFVVAKENQQVELSDINTFLLEQGLAKFKLPERLEHIKALPRNPLGKVQRFTLEEQLKC